MLAVGLVLVLGGIVPLFMMAPRRCHEYVPGGDLCHRMIDLGPPILGGFLALVGIGLMLVGAVRLAKHRGPGNSDRAKQPP